jgi:hypothetical protein
MSDPEKSAAPNGAATSNTSPPSDPHHAKSKNDTGSQSKPQAISHWRMISDQGVTNAEIENWHYKGAGTEEDPYAVEWIDNDPRNPFGFSFAYRWSIVLFSAFAVLTVSLCSSAFNGGLPEIIEEFGVSEEVSILGLSLFVLGFALGRKLPTISSLYKANM